MDIQMLFTALNRVTSLPIGAHIVGVIGTFAWFIFIKGKLDASYGASNHPVDYATGQTTFDGAKIKEFYAHMDQLGTLDIYWQTQLIDFGFIAAVALLGIFFCTLVARLSRPDSWGHRIGIFAGISAMLGAGCDSIENGWSFIMLMNPTDFANWLAIPYSAFAVAKFALITLAMATVIASLALAAAGRITNRPNLG